MNAYSIRSFADYVLLNAYSINQPGFYNGKAGLSLALFEVARLLQDEYLEEHAYELIKEALVDGKRSLYSFENGLSGIGYVLRYLINNGFIEADFNELFGYEVNEMKSKFEEEGYLQSIQKQSVTMGYFFNSPIEAWKLTEQTINELNRLLEAPFLSSPLLIKKRIFKQYELLLKVIASCTGDIDVSELLYKYTVLYQKGLGVSNFFIGYYMRQLAKQRNEIIEVAEQIMSRSLANYRPEVLPLSQCIDWLYLLRKNETLYQHEIQILENQLINPERMALKQALNQFISPGSLICSYENGISRWLLYAVYWCASKRGEDTTRFNDLFK